MKCVGTAGLLPRHRVLEIYNEGSMVARMAVDDLRSQYDRQNALGLDATPERSGYRRTMETIVTEGTVYLRHKSRCPYPATAASAVILKIADEDNQHRTICR